MRAETGKLSTLWVLTSCFSVLATEISELASDIISFVVCRLLPARPNFLSRHFRLPAKDFSKRPEVSGNHKPVKTITHCSILEGQSDLASSQAIARQAIHPDELRILIGGQA
jgi:hypothetical protein